MKKTGAILLIITGVILITFSILALVRAFEVFQYIGKDSDSLGYVFGSILFPLLLTVVGRWVYRKGKEMWKLSKEKRA